MFRAGLVFSALLLNQSLLALELVSAAKADPPPILDGRLTEGIWSKAPAIGPFRTYGLDQGTLARD